MADEHEVAEVIRSQQQWEYAHMQNESLGDVKDYLADAGTDGWELVQVVSEPGQPVTWHVFLKRPRAYEE